MSGGSLRAFRAPRLRPTFAIALPIAAVAVLDPAGLAPFGPAKWAAATTAIAISASIVLRRRSVVLDPSLGRWWLAFLVAATVAAFAAIDPLHAWIGTPERHFGWLTWALCATAFVLGQQPFVLGQQPFVLGQQPFVLRQQQGATRPTVPAVAIVAVGAVAGLWAVAEVGGWEPIDLVGAGRRPTSIMGSSAFLGALASLAMPPAIGLMIQASRAHRLWGVLSCTGTALTAVALVASGARAAWFGVGVGVIAFALLRRRDIGASMRRVATTTALVVVVAIAFVVSVALATGAPGRLAAVVTDEDGGVRGRLDEWRVAARVIADHPVTGVGHEGYRVAFAEVVDPDYEREHGRDPLPDRAHSAPLDVAATVGVPGAMLYLALIAAVMRRTLRAAREGDHVTAGLAVAVIAYFAQSLFLFPIAELDIVAWLLAGAVVVASRAGETGRAARTYALPRAARALALAAIAVAAVAGLLDVAADRAARGILQDVADQESPADPGLPARLRPDAVRYRLVAARGFEASSAPRSRIHAMQELASAGRLSPNDPVVDRELARLLLDRARVTEDPGDVDRALRQLTALAARDPHNAETQLRLGLAFALDGDSAHAERAWGAAEALAPTSQAPATNLAIAYARQGRIADAQRAAERALERAAAKHGT